MLVRPSLAESAVSKLVPCAAALAALAVGSFILFLRNRPSNARSECARLVAAIEQYKEMHNVFPIDAPLLKGMSWHWSYYRVDGGFLLSTRLPGRVVQYDSRQRSISDLRE